MVRYKSPFPTLTPWGWVKDGDELTQEQVKWLQDRGFANRIEEEIILTKTEETTERKPSKTKTKNKGGRHDKRGNECQRGTHENS